jgi:hypothetical protein
MKVHVRFGFLWQLSLAIGSLVGLYLIILTVSTQGIASFKNVTVLVSALLMMPVFCCIMPFSWVTVDGTGILIHGGFGLLMWEIKELRHRSVQWGDVLFVTSVLPRFWPIRVIIVQCSVGEKIVSFPLGSLLAHSRAAIRLIADHVPMDRIEPEALKYAHYKKMEEQ